MGWWNAPDNPEVTVGDAVLDTVRHFLRDFSREYQEDLSRKPTLQELEYALNVAFKINTDSDILSGFDELEIKRVTIKTAKRSKRQKAKPGDIFSYKLDNGRYGFGRIVSLVSVGAVAEFFDYTATQPVFDYSKIDTWLIPPLTISTYSLFEAQGEGEWRIIGHTADFIPNERYTELRFSYGAPVWMTADIFDNEESVSAAVAGQFPSYSARRDRNVKNDIEKYLGANR
ncbi:MAG TPA: Imm26 family immunity protein [Telluria sp.]|jgi:hypothetical protein